MRWYMDKLSKSGYAKSFIILWKIFILDESKRGLDDS